MAKKHVADSEGDGLEPPAGVEDPPAGDPPVPPAVDPPVPDPVDPPVPPAVDPPAPDGGEPELEPPAWAAAITDRLDRIEEGVQHGSIGAAPAGDGAGAGGNRDAGAEGSDAATEAARQAAREILGEEKPKAKRRGRGWIW